MKHIIERFNKLVEYGKSIPNAKIGIQGTDEAIVKFKIDELQSHYNEVQKYMNRFVMIGIKKNEK